MSPTRMSPQDAAYVAWTEHRFFKYRGCAPDPDNPRLAVGSVERDGRSVQVPLDAWHGPDVDGGEEQRVRRERVEAAKEVCLNCPVMVQCDAYAGLVPSREKEVRGGRTTAERGRLAGASEPKRRAPVPVSDSSLRTPQKLAVLEALAVSADEYWVAMETGLGVRKANWQRAKLTHGLGLESSASRMELLRAAVARGLVDGALVVPDGGRVPAIPPSTRKLLIEVDGQFLLWPSDPSEVKETAAVRRSGRCSGRPRSLRDRFPSVAGQEAFDVDAMPDDWAYVHDLFPSEPALEVAA
ncbi:MAG TPA: WhiB family transcriptional regulator [Streptomyces sp.]